MIIPVVKLGTLAIRTLSKPIANRLKRGAGLHPAFRDFIIHVAQANHRLSINLQRKIYGQSTHILIRPLNEERAIQAAAGLLGELVIFTVAGAAIIYEVQRSAKSEAKKEEQRKKELEALHQENKNLVKEVNDLKQKLQQMEELSKRRFLDHFKFWYPTAQAI